MLRLEGKLLVQAKSNCVHAFSSLILHCASLVNPDSTVFTQKKTVQAISKSVPKCVLNTQ